jgi:signal transduction histidine kinase
MSAKILNVDDYLPGRYARTRVLRDAGFEVVEAGTGEEALRAVREHHPDLVLLDYNLPDMTGVDVCREIKTTPEGQAMPVLQISATSHAVEVKVEAMNVGADTYLSEPIPPVELVAHVRAALRWRWAEERLRESNARIAALYEEAQRANRAKDEFLAVLSHELRTPLNAMLGWLQLLRGDRLAEAQRTQAIATIERNAYAQGRLIEDLLDVSRIVTGQLVVASETVDLVPVLRTALETVHPQADAKGLALVEQIAEPRALVLGDAARLQQVTVNLLGNAVKFTDAGTVTLALRRRDGRIVVEVTDTGAGIDTEFLPHVFDHFRQADSSIARPHGGLGIGLAISRYLVEAHRGTLTGHSAGPGRGSTFAFDLPEVASRRAAEDRGDSAQRAEVDDADQPLAGMRVLLVEDDHDSREMMMLMLEQVGAAVDTAANAAAALKVLDRGPAPDVMLADVGLPHMDGHALMREVRRRGVSLPAVALTGYAAAADRDQALAAGFDDHLGKPVAPEAVIDVLRRVRRRNPSQA